MQVQAMGDEDARTADTFARNLIENASLQFRSSASGLQSMAAASFDRPLNITERSKGTSGDASMLEIGALGGANEGGGEAGG